MWLRDRRSEHLCELSQPPNLRSRGPSLRVESPGLGQTVAARGALDGAPWGVYWIAPPGKRTSDRVFGNRLGLCEIAGTAESDGAQDSAMREILRK